MADKSDNRKQVSPQYRFDGKNIDKVSFEKRRVANLLPGVHQTETIQKFFGASADHLFEPGKSKPLNGYIGRSVNYTEEATNYYLDEDTNERAFYQLEPSMVSVDENGDNKALLFYEDLINSLRFQGGIVNNHDRLFSQNYFSWCPSIDLDKFLNYREYCWVPEGPNPVEIRGNAAKYTANGSAQDFPVSNNYPAPQLASQIMVTVDGVSVPFSYNYDPSDGGIYSAVNIAQAPAKDSIVKVYTAVSINNEVVGKKTFTFENDITLESNQRVIIRNDKDANLIGKIFIVENVGESIMLIPDDQPDLTLRKDFITIQRGAKDGNPWSTTNRWFHKSLLADFAKENVKNIQATRPIIEFVRDIQLYNYGSTKRKPVHLVSHSAPDFLGAVNGLVTSTKRIDGQILDRAWIEQNGDNGKIRVLVVNDEDSRITNRIYLVSFNETTSKLKATLVADGADVSGAPVLGESVDVLFGTSMGGTNLFWDGNNWTTSQSKNRVNQFPLFKLFDVRGNSFDDPAVYPNSTFVGNRLFGYREDTTLSSVMDKVLNLRLVYDSKGEIVFENYLATFQGTYRVGVDEFDLPSQRYYKIVTNDNEILINDWYSVDKVSRQMVVDKMVAANGSHLYSASQEPAEPVEQNLRVTKNNEVMKLGEDFIRRYNQILFVDANDGDQIEIATYNPENKPMHTTGQYEIPLNLQANPKWDQVTYATRGDLFNHFIEIIRGQTGFAGLEYSSNNWKDLAKDLSLGLSIVSHTAPLLRTMLLSSSSDLNFTKAVSFAQDEYARFRGKFDQKIKEFIISNRLGNTATPAQWVELALEEISKGLTQEFPFFYSQMAQVEGNSARHFIPPTPSFLGIYPIQEPTVYTDPVINKQFIVGHDASIFPFYGDIRDEVTLELERRIYFSAPEYIRNHEDGFFDVKQFVSDKNYQSEYSVSELNTILRPMFEKWAVNFGIDYRTNDTFDINDPFTWNWRSCVDSDNKPLPGHWRGIYNFYYGTDRPHTHPWEMLGFKYQPTWWIERYGPAPYGSGNIPMWRDIQQGKIVEGSRAGTYSRFAKPKLLEQLPVDDQGNLLDPLQAKITNVQPRSVKINDEWAWGDGAPAEAAWKQSFWYPFALAQACFLMKPASFVETTWDITRNLEENLNRGYGYPYANEYVHGELQFDGTIAYKHGSQQWVVDYLKSKNKDITENLGSLIRGLDAKLTYKIAGFTDSNSLFVVSDNIDRIPPEDVNVELYKSPSIREEFLGGILLRKDPNGWKVFGYDILDPVFKVIPSLVGGRSVSVSAGPAVRTKVPTWKASTYYPQNNTIRHIDKYYRSIKTHTSGSSFESEYWVEVARPTFADASAVNYYIDSKNDSVVERIPYGSLLKSPQEVANLISGYERYLESRGWKFDSIDAEQQTIYDWKLSLKDFLAWAQDENTKAGDIISLMPNSNEIRFETDHGNVEPIEQIVNGVYSILDKLGNPIKAYNTNVIRNDGQVVIQTRSNQQMFACRIHVSEIEHVIAINNTTIFGDIVYSPLFNIRQARLRLQGFKTINWKGRVDAPGFLVNGNLLTVNFEKAADDFRRLFDIESIENNQLKERARANFGFSEKPYLSNLLMTPTNQFEFHQGMIQQKGTRSAMQKLFRSEFVRHNEGLNVLEEWAFRVGEYGASEIKPSMDFLIKQSDFKNNPQLYQFNGSGQGGWDLRLAWDEDHWDYINNIETIRINYSINGLKRVIIQDAGEGYTQVPEVRVVGDTSGAQLRAVLDWSNSAVASIRVINGGTGFFEGDFVEFDGTGLNAKARAKTVDYAKSKILSAVIIPNNGVAAAGTGYQVGDEIRVVGGNNNGRLIVAETTETGAITKLAVSSPGAGYSPNYAFQFPTNNSTADGRIMLTMTGGRLLELEVLDGGVGYEPSVSPRFTGTGRSAILEITVSGGKIKGIEVVNKGGGFQTAPVIEFVGGGQPTRPAQAIAEIQTEMPNPTVQLAKFKQLNGVILKSITVRVSDPFNGVQPQLTIGDLNDPQRYVGAVNLASTLSKTFALDDGPQISNIDYDITAFVTNAQESGNLEISFTFEYTPNYYANLLRSIGDEQSTKILDLFNNTTGEFMHKDSRWVWRHSTKNPDWPLVEVESNQKGNLPSAGYTHLDDIQWTVKNTAEFNALYRSIQRQEPAAPIVNEITVKYVGSSTTTRKINIVPNLSQGRYRVKNFVVQINEAFPTTIDNTPEVYISIGTTAEPEKFMTRTAVDTNKLQTYTHQVYEYITSRENEDNALFVFVSQVSGLAVSPGLLTVEANLELINDIVLPGDRAWVYDAGDSEWNVYRFGDTKANVSVVRPQSFDGQGTVVSTNRDMFEALSINHNYQEPKPEFASLNPTFLSDIEQAEARMDKVILDGISPDNNTTEMLLNTYKAKFKNSVKIFVDAASAIKNNGVSLLQIPIMDLWADSGIVINKITASVVRPFTFPAGQNPTITIGTLTDPDRFVGAVNSESAYRNVKAAPSRPTFSYASPITVNVYDDEISLNETDTSANLRLLRSGNVFVTPSAITVTNPGWGYTSTSDPKIAVLGPTGVKAKAKVVGTIIGYAVTNAGTGYTSEPSITVIGGGGTGATGRAIISNGQLQSVVIPGAGTGTSATANLNGGELGGISGLVGGSGWEMKPIVTLEGGSPTEHAAISVEMSNGVITGVNLDYKGSGYKSAPTVKFNAYTGDNYTAEPRVIVSGGGGTGATVEPIMIWTVRSIAITDWGKCSWIGGDATVTVEAPNGGAPAQAVLESTPETLAPTTIQQWRYRIVEPQTNPAVNQWVYVSDPIEFPAPTGTNSPDFYQQVLTLPLPSVDDTTIYEVEIPEYVIDETTGAATTTLNVTNGVLGTANKSLVTLYNTISGNRDLDLKVAGTVTPFYLNERINSDNKLVAFYNSDGVSDGLLTLVVDYHYTNCFELFDLDDNPVRTSITGQGGDIFAWNSVRFANVQDVEDPYKLPVDPWTIGDRILLDDGRSKLERALEWMQSTTYQYHELVTIDGIVYRAIQSGTGLEVTIAPLENNDQQILDRPKIVNRGTLYTHEPTATIIGDGEGATARVTLAPTSIYKIKVLNPDSNFGYTGNEKVLITPKNIPGRGAEAKINKVEDGAIKEIAIIDGGWGYDAAPIVTIVNDTSTEPVQLECVMKPARIKNVIMTDRGLGYTTASIVFTRHDVTTTEFVPQEWEVATEADAGWRVLELFEGVEGEEWLPIRNETPKINTDLIDSAVIYDIATGETLQTLQLYDPYKGFIPSSAKKEISYLLEYDPAIYSNGPLAKSVTSNERLWDSAKVGDLWWDISTTRYLDYEIGETDYKWKNWGKLAPGITIDIYEWTRSTVAPAFWEAEVEKNRNVAVESNEQKPTGTVKDITTNPSWVERVEFNPTLNRNETVYYFWVKNAATKPMRQDRDLTAVQVASIIQDPSAADIPWFAVVDTNKLIIGGAKQYVNDYSTSFKLSWKTNNKDNVVHKQWKLLREEDERNNIDDSLWNKMRDSLVGWDNNKTKKTLAAVTTTELNSTSTSLRVDDATGFDLSGEIKIGDYWIQYQYLIDNTFYGLSNVGSLRFNVGTRVYQPKTIETFRKVPDQWLNERERYGSLVRPAQTLFRADTDAFGFLIPGREARKTFVDSMNEIFASDAFLDARFEWREIFDTEQAEPDASKYSFRVVDEFDRDQLSEFGSIIPGQKVLMQGTPNTNGFWTLWIYLPEDSRATESGFVLVEAQRYRLREGELWTAVDWYDSEWSANDYPVKRYATKADRDNDRQLDTTLLRGTLVQVDNQGNGDDRWAWYVFRNNTWVQVAKEKATIRLNDNFYAKGKIVYGFNDYKVANTKNRDGSWELKFILDSVRTKLLTGLERNKLFFSMVKTAVSQHNYTDWAFKTSFLYMAGYDEKLTQNPVVFKDQIQNILDYIEDVKPYHVKVRDFVRRLKPPMELANITITDFDKPMYWDQNANNGRGVWRKLDVENPVDELILKNDSQLKHWYENYEKTNYSFSDWNEKWNPIRRPKIKVKYDRVSCKPLVGWSQPEMPWDGNEQRWVNDTYTHTFAELSDSYRIPGTKYTEFVLETMADLDRVSRESQNLRNIGAQPTLNMGDIAYVKADFNRELATFMWDGSSWIQFYNVHWDLNGAGGLADRIEKHYEPRANMRRKELDVLIRGCDFRGTIVDGSDGSSGVWDMFTWDMTGWDMEYEYFVGRDLDINPVALTSNVDFDEGVVKDANGNIINRGTYGDNIDINGGESIQPWIDQGHPDELVKIRVREPLVVTVYKATDEQIRAEFARRIVEAEQATLNGDETHPFYNKAQEADDVVVSINGVLTTINGSSYPGNSGNLQTTQANAFRFFKDTSNNWEGVYLEEDGLRLDAELNATDREMIVVSANTVELHDPANPNTALLREKIALSVNIDLSPIQVTDPITGVQTAEPKVLLMGDLRRPRPVDVIVQRQNHNFVEGDFIKFTSKGKNKIYSKVANADINKTAIGVVTRTWIQLIPPVNPGDPPTYNHYFSYSPYGLAVEEERLIGIYRNLGFEDKFKEPHPTDSNFMIPFDDERDVTSIINEHIDMIIGRYVEGVVWVGSERITYTGIENLGNNQYKLTGLTRATGGSSRNDVAQINTPVYDGSVLHALLSFNTTNLRAQSVLDYTKNWKNWNAAANNSTRPGPIA